MNQQYIDELEALIIHIDEFVHDYPGPFWFLITLLFITAVIDGLRAYFIRKRSRMYFCCGSDSELCKYRVLWSKKLRGSIIVPEIYDDYFVEAEDFRKELRLVSYGKRKN